MAWTIRFHLDECCDPATAEGLRRRSVDVTACWQCVAFPIGKEFAKVNHDTHCRTRPVHDSADRMAANETDGQQNLSGLRPPWTDWIMGCQ
jgi:hypothetical protein